MKEKLKWLDFVAVGTASMFFFGCIQATECKRLTGHWIERSYKVLLFRYVKYFDPHEPNHADGKQLLELSEPSKVRVYRHLGFIPLPPIIQFPESLMVHFTAPVTLKNGDKVICSCQLEKVVDHEMTPEKNK